MMTEEDRASLVAYLDGELDDEAARQVEARISTDPAVRAEIESLERTWDLLDYLPKAEPSPNFTHRTVSRITAAHVALRTSQQRRRRWLLGTAWAAALLVALAGGYGAVLLLAPHEPTDDEIQRHLRVLENRKQYEQIDSLDFLRALDQPDLFGDDDDTETGG